MSQAKTGTIFHWREEEKERPSLTQVVSELQKVGLLPKRESWWFAWQEVKIELPRELDQLSDIRTDWDVLHIFSPHAEFRQIRRGRRYEWLLLTEEELPLALSFPRREKKDEPTYQTIPSHRIMWGERLKKGEETGVEEARGEVKFPRPLEYKVANEGRGNYDKAVVADVCLYFDDEARLQTVRYMRIYHLPPGADKMRMKTFGDVMEEAFP